MNLKQIQEQIESTDYQFRHTGNHEFVFKQEIQLLKETLKGIANGDLEGKEAEASKLVLESLKKA